MKMCDFIKKYNLILIILLLIILAGLSIYFLFSLEKPLENYEFSVSGKDNGDPFIGISNFLLEYDFKKQEGNISMKLTDKNLNGLKIHIPKECNLTSRFDGKLQETSGSYPNSIHEFKFYKPQITEHEDGFQTLPFLGNLTCKKLSNNARFSMNFHTTNYTRGLTDSAKDYQKTLIKFKFGNLNKICKEDCFIMDYADNPHIRIGKHKKEIWVYSLKENENEENNEKNIKTIQFYIKTRKPLMFAGLWIFSSVFIAILSTLIYDYLKEKKILEKLGQEQQKVIKNSNLTNSQIRGVLNKLKKKENSDRIFRENLNKKINAILKANKKRGKIKK